MKKYGIMTLAIAFMLSLAVSAQEQMPREKGQKNQQRKEKPMMNPQMRAERMAKELKLTEVEKSKVQALFEKQEANFKKQQEERKKQHEAMKAQFEAERKMQDAEMEKIIGAEKFKQLQSMRIDRLQREVVKMKQHKMRNNRMEEPQKP